MTDATLSLAAAPQFGCCAMRLTISRKYRMSGPTICAERALCVPKTKSERTDDEVRPGWRVN